MKYPWERANETTPDAYDDKPIFCIDFDGTLMRYDGWMGAHLCTGRPIIGAMEWLASVVADGHFDVHIHSSRSHQRNGVHAMRQWVAMHLSAANLPVTETIKGIYFPKVKPPAKVALDDRVITFDGEYPTVAKLKAFQAYES